MYSLLYRIVRLYSNIYWYFHITFHLNLPGLGLLLRLIKDDHICNVDGISFIFKKKLYFAYSRIIAGCFNEPETHIFLNKIISNIGFDVTFIDIGSNIGEFILDVCRYKNVRNVIGFEPDYKVAKVSQENISKNKFENVSVIEKVVNSDGVPARFIVHPSRLSSNIMDTDNPKSVLLEATTLDLEFPIPIGPSIILIDVEGAEPLVLRGGRKLISRDNPLIIFEYNQISKKYFKLNEIYSILGVDYEIYRLRQDSFLDTDFRKTWNCVAINIHSEFYPLIKKMIKRKNTDG